MSLRYRHVMSSYKKAAVADGWWNNDGAIAGVVAAYAAKGAASYTASKINLANPGTYNAGDGNAPAWDAINGWKLAATSSHYLTTGITPTSSWSVLIRISNLTNGEDTWAFGNYAATGWGIEPGYDKEAADKKGTTYINGNGEKIAADRTSGVWGLAGAQGYYNGVSECDATVGTASPNAGIFIGDVSGAYRRYINAYIKNFAIYNLTLTGADVLTISNAMAAE